MSRALGWEERHTFLPANLRHLADVIEKRQADQPQVIPWCVDVVAPKEVWASYDGELCPRCSDDRSCGMAGIWGAGGDMPEGHH
jgi:hypothetical protein